MVGNKEGKEESRKRGMIEPEKREGEMTNKVEKENLEKIEKSERSEFFPRFFRGFSFSTLLATPSSFFQV